MEVVIVPDAPAGGKLVASAITRLLHDKPEAVLGLATGTSPYWIYQTLIESYEGGHTSFKRSSAFLLDEFLAPLDDPSPEVPCYFDLIRSEFTDHVDFQPGTVHAPNNRPLDVRDECVRYENLIADSGGIDLQLLGISPWGHIAFNEPTSSLSSRTRIKTLTEWSRLTNAELFNARTQDEDWSINDDPLDTLDPQAVPIHVITQGVGTILEARHLILVAFGAEKADAVASTVEGPVASVVPASALQLHPHATIVIDEKAADKLENKIYYRTVMQMKPGWQHDIA